MELFIWNPSKKAHSISTDPSLPKLLALGVNTEKLRKLPFEQQEIVQNVLTRIAADNLADLTEQLSANLEPEIITAIQFGIYSYPIATNLHNRVLNINHNALQFPSVSIYVNNHYPFIVHNN